MKKRMKISFRIVIFMIALSAILLTAGIYCKKTSFDEANIGDTIYYEEDEDSGTLKLVVQNAAWYASLADAGISKEELEMDFCGQAFDEETGALLEGYHVVLLDVEIENIDAVSQGHSQVLGQQYSDNVFRADMLNLADVTKKKVTSQNFYINNLAYFSERNTCQEHPFAYRLSMGEKRVFTLGYLVEKDNLESLYLCPTSGYVKGAFAAISD